MLSVVYVAIGGACGAVLRYALLRWMPPPTDGLPYATITANLVGCLLIGLAAGWFASPLGEDRAHLRPLIVVGFLGGLTTFSTYGWETYAFASNGRFLLAGANLLLSNLVGLAAIWAGHQLAIRLS